MRSVKSAERSATARRAARGNVLQAGQGREGAARGVHGCRRLAPAPREDSSGMRQRGGIEQPPAGPGEWHAATIAPDGCSVRAARVYWALMSWRLMTTISFIR
jgi:hypothetical protein